MKVDEQPGPHSEQPEISDDLSLVNGQDPLDRLDFHDEAVIDEEIHSIPALERHPLEAHGHWDLPFEAQSS